MSSKQVPGTMQSMEFVLPEMDTSGPATCRATAEVAWMVLLCVMDGEITKYMLLRNHKTLQKSVAEEVHDHGDDNEITSDASHSNTELILTR